MPDNAGLEPDNAPNPPPKRRFSERLKRLKSGSKKAFWLWVGYQAVKGALTTALIWIPLWLIWWRGE